MPSIVPAVLLSVTLCALKFSPASLIHSRKPDPTVTALGRVAVATVVFVTSVVSRLVDANVIDADVAATAVVGTVPPPPVVHVMLAAPPPADVKNCPLVPAVSGRLKL